MIRNAITVAGLLVALMFLGVVKTPGAEASWKGHHVRSCHTLYRHGHVVRKGHGRHRHKVVRCHRRWKPSREYHRRARAVHFAKTKLGAPYRWGAAGPYAFDCSGLMVWSYAHVGRYLPRTTYSQLRFMRGKHAHLRLGDLVFRGDHHVGMYVGHGRVIHAPHTGSTVRYIGLSYFNHVRSPF